jgi:hypothetical protein
MNMAWNGIWAIAVGVGFYYAFKDTMNKDLFYLGLYIIPVLYFMCGNIAGILGFLEDQKKEKEQIDKLRKSSTL